MNPDKISKILREEFANPTSEDPRNELLVAGVLKEILETVRQYDEKSRAGNPPTPQDYCGLGERLSTLTNILQNEETQLGYRFLRHLSEDQRKLLLAGFLDSLSNTLKICIFHGVFSQVAGGSFGTEP